MCRCATVHPEHLRGDGAAATPETATDVHAAARIVLFVIRGLRLKNPNNGSIGNSRVAGIIRAREAAEVRDVARFAALAAIRKGGFDRLFASGATMRVQLLRVSPGKLDAWDGLPASFKRVIDGIALAFGAKVRDDDHRFEWLPPKQEKRGKGVYGVEVTIEASPGPASGQSMTETERSAEKHTAPHRLDSPMPKQGAKS